MPRRLPDTPETTDPFGTPFFPEQPGEAESHATGTPARTHPPTRGTPRQDVSVDHSAGETVTGSAGKGWAAHKRNKQKAGGFAKEFQVTEGDERLIKFLDDEPFDSYYRHWLRGAKGRQTFVCLGEDCPLCAIGDNATFVILFNVVDLSEGDRETVKVWVATPNPAAAIEEFALSAKNSPINRSDLYFSVTKKKGSNGFFSYSMLPVKERDLRDDWETTGLTGPELAGLEKNRHGSEFIRADSRETLREVASSLDEA